MKKYVITAVLIVVLVAMTGCGGSDDEKTYNSDWKGAIESSQGIQIKSADGSQVFATYSEDAEIEGFIKELSLSQWEESEIPDGTEKEYTAVFYNIEADGNQTVVANITTYKDSSIVSLDSLGLSLAFEVPQSALDAIRTAG